MISRTFIDRWVADFGNSTNQQMINGYYFEMPSSIYEITKEDAEALFAQSVDKEALIDQLVVRVPIDEKDRYFKVGNKAKADVLGNRHIEKLHDKTESQTVWVTWLTGMAFYHAYMFPSKKEDTIEVQYFGTLIPVWLAKRAKKFTEILSKMANRFIREEGFEVELLTPDFERTLTIIVKEAKSRVEGETARYALKYDLELNKNEEQMKKHEAAIVVIDDLGGQTQDLSKLRPGLKKPASADDYASFTDKSFLKMLEDLRITKLMTHFNDLRSLEEFVRHNIKSKQFIYKDPTTKSEVDFTAKIEVMLREYVKIASEKCLTAFQYALGEEVYFLHIGGVAEEVQDYMMEYLIERLGKEIAEKYHLFPEHSRKFNIHGLEIVAKSHLKKKAENAKEPTDGEAERAV